MALDDSVIDEVSRSADIVSVIGGYIPLKKAGQNFKACCPFHQEKTASFVVSPQKQIFHCFGCGAGGNVFSFLMKYENMTFPEAVKHLAQKIGIVIPEERKVSKADLSQKRLLDEVYAETKRFFIACLNSDIKGAHQAREYLRSRGVSSDTAKVFGIGYSPNEWHALFDHLNKKGFSQKLIFSSGLVMQSVQGSAYDFFRGRLMFPISNVRDRVVGFGGRTLTGENPKYINTAETENFRKRFELYGLNAARREITASGSFSGIVFVVEGYLDVVSLYQAGIRNAVAPLGTSLTQDHVRILKRYAEQAILVFDGDQAGIKAALRSIGSFLQEGLPVKVLVLPDKHDPDSFVREKGLVAFEQLAVQAKDVFDFKFSVLRNRYKLNDPTDVVKITEEMLELVEVSSNGLLRDQYIYKLSNYVNVSEKVLREEIARRKQSLRKDATEENSSFSVNKAGSLNRNNAELHIIQILISNPIYCKLAFDILCEEDFDIKETRDIFCALFEMFNAGETINFAMLTNRVRQESTKKILSELAMYSVEEESVDEALQNRIREIKLTGYERRRRELHLLIKQAEEEGDEEGSLKFLQSKMKIEKEIQELKTKRVKI